MTWNKGYDFVSQGVSGICSLPGPAEGWRENDIQASLLTVENLVLPGLKTHYSTFLFHLGVCVRACMCVYGYMCLCLCVCMSVYQLASQLLPFTPHL